MRRVSTLPKEQRGFLMGFLLGPLAFLRTSTPGDGVSPQRIAAGWICGWLGLSVLVTMIVVARNVAEEHSREIAREAALREEMRVNAERSAKEREAAVAAKRAAAQRERERVLAAARSSVKDAQSANLELRGKVNEIFAGKYSDFTLEDMRFLDTRPESLELVGLLGPIGADESEETLGRLEEKVRSDSERIRRRIARLEEEYEKKKAADTERKLAAREKCERCSGAGVYKARLKCKFCNGALKVNVNVECPTCHGGGNEESEGSCPQCKGRGTDSSSCARCGGKGQVKCAACDGQGGRLERPYKPGLGGRNMALRSTFVKCTSCGGRRVLKCSYCANATCSECDGSGVVVLSTKCHTCKGGGIQKKVEDCVHCDHGYTEELQDCSACHGRGWTSPLE